MSPTPQELIDHARHLEQIDGRARRRGFHVPVRLEPDYQRTLRALRTARYPNPSIAAAKSLGINIDRTV